MIAHETVDLSLLKPLTILYVEDDDALRGKMLEFLHMVFATVHAAENGKQGLEAFDKYAPDLVITDIKMPMMDGLEMARQVKRKRPDTPVIITTAFSETGYLIKAIEIGIDRYVQKPIDLDLLLEALYKCGLPLTQQRRIDTLSKALYLSLAQRLGSGKPMQTVIKRISQVAASDFSVVLQGETGVGKSMVAGIIHELSSRADKPFVTLDLGSIPETLVESELFGYKKGAFTGAVNNKIGFMESADGGTLFFDDIENLPLPVQAKLLRAVDEKKIYPVGSTTAVQVDVRLLSAANRDLRQAVQAGTFRQDLYYRLMEFDIHIPPLRERPGDIEWLACHFIADAAGELDKHIGGISEEAVELLQRHTWPGNVRELKNVIRRAVLLCEETEIAAAHLAPLIAYPAGTEAREAAAALSLPQGLPSLALEEVEKWVIRQALKQTGGKRMKAARILGIDYKRFMRKIKKYGIKLND
jgi:DNA-binding NtrC family response regulator